MKSDPSNPQIDSAKLSIGGGIAGAIFAIGSVLIFLFGIPVLRYLFPVAVLLGCALALVFRMIRHKTPGAPWLLSAIEKDAEAQSKGKAKDALKGSTRASFGDPVVAATTN